VYCCDGRSQWENRLKARAELEQRLSQSADVEAASKLNADRASQVVADRSAKQFTWNMQRGTVVDHSTGRTWRLRDFQRGRI